MTWHAVGTVRKSAKSGEPLLQIRINKNCRVLDRTILSPDYYSPISTFRRYIKELEL